MPLSEHEQQMLAQMEQALASEDPRFAHQMRGGTTLAVRRRRLVLGILGVVIGLALVEAKWADGARVRVVFPMVACETGVELADGPEWGALCYYAPGHEPMPVWTADAPQ